MSRAHVYSPLAAGIVLAAPAPVFAASLFEGIPETFSYGAVFCAGAVCSSVITAGLMHALYLRREKLQARAHARAIKAAVNEEIKHSLTAKTPSYIEHGSELRVQHLSQAANEPTGVGEATSRGARHLRKQDWDATGTIRVRSFVEQQALEDRLEQAAAGSLDAGVTGLLKMSAPTAAQISVAQKHSIPDDSEPCDYIDIAMGYVRHLDLKNRLSARVAGVAQTLRDRIGADMMEGMPIIERADGTVGDVGTSWWDAAVGNNKRSVTSIFAEEEELESIESLQSQVHELKEQTSKMTQEELYPETTSSVSEEKLDMWALALAALDEKIDSEIAEQSYVGSAQTAFPSSSSNLHSENFDTGSYINLLIEDEMQSNRDGLYDRARKNMVVLEGGSQVMPPLKSELDESQHPRHLRRAQEA